MFNPKDLLNLTKDNPLMDNITLVYLNTSGVAEMSAQAMMFGMYTIDGEEACLDYIKAFSNLITRRTNLFDANGEKNIKTYNEKHPNSKMSIITCYLDNPEIATSTRFYKEVIDSIKTTSIRTGICLVLANQPNYQVNTDMTLKASNVTYSTSMLLDVKTGKIRC